ncbi:MAG TPA: L-seryl-tRNA(Sec) selenium transferase [Candidatus Acidoferrales bacterium]|nr:L-seryl-tRNA(Sec) selenium transferase [Candidatus Acidoferrales bacterium]
MKPSTKSARKAQRASSAVMRGIPSVDELLGRPRLLALAENAGRSLVTQSVRGVLADLRAVLKKGRGTDDGASADSAQLELQIIAKVEAALAPSLVRVINATGVILHTNLGRAPLSSQAAAHISEIATRYSNLEYDLASGNRGQRDVHTARMFADLAGAEAAIVVNNNAAAVFLVLNTLSKGAETIVSRGELIEIGDGFRIPDIMAESGAIVREVGTTNRTRIRDYERAVTKNTGLLLRVHPSNFRMTGFTAGSSLEELVALGRRSKIPVFEDLGSGCLANLTASGISEPVVAASCAAGVSVVSFSGDKLLGGPQAGIIAGKKQIIERIRRNPLFRALRVDKLTIAALEVTLRAYLRGALDEIPALRMIRFDAEAVAERARSFVAQLQASVAKDVTVRISEGFSVIGGGSTPDQQLPTNLISITSARHSPDELEKRLRKPGNATPVIARIENKKLILDLRTVLTSEEPELATALASALS